MRILPDLNFRENYKKRYAENYERLSKKYTDRISARRSRPPVSSELIVRQVVGCIAFFAVLISVFLIGVHVANIFNEKQACINELYTLINETDETIKSYQTINSEAMQNQIDDILLHVIDLQNQHLSQDYSYDFETLSDMYLDNYNTDWSEGIDNLDGYENLSWRGYLDKSSDFQTGVHFIYLLCSDDIPIMIVSVDYSLDNVGDIDRITNIDKLVLSS